MSLLYKIFDSKTIREQILDKDDSRLLAISYERSTGKNFNVEVLASHFSSAIKGIAIGSLCAYLSNESIDWLSQDMPDSIRYAINIGMGSVGGIISKKYFIKNHIRNIVEKIEVEPEDLEKLTKENIEKGKYK